MSSDHSAHSHDTHASAPSWEGGSEPFKASYGKLMMWYFLLSDAFTFSAFLVAYGTLRFSMPTWPVPDFVFSTLPFGIHHQPLIFVTIMTFVLIMSSVTMVRAVQEGHRENKKGVVYWMFLTIIGGLMFLGCQAWEWTTLIKGESMSITKNPFGTHTENGVYLEGDGHDIKEGDRFEAGQSYLIHYHDGHYQPLKMKTDAGEIKVQQMGPKAFGALFFFITGFHGFHVFSGVVFLLIIMLNVASGIYSKRKNGYEMVEKIGLYWHFVDLVWVFVFLVFYLL
ncbi:MAG: cytochrome c oxidase subunit 3 [Saprospiraceae bacterium]|nr:cytochrome c oxidase subunit 3 [Saprospiraceae bacterium]MBK9632812.1 cytochrome c oxidase subunit 3 [Saprospiraceae bacterium]